MTRPAASAYRRNLAYIHDVGFGGFAEHASAVVLELLEHQGLRSGRVIDLGCGSGILAEAVSRAGYEVLGFDISRAMVELSRKRVPAAEFRHASFLSARLARCVAVTAIGEIFNYLFDKRNTKSRLDAQFHRVYEALVPGGLLVFDVATCGRVPERRRRSFMEGRDWVCLVEAEEDSKRKTLVRRITSFRKDKEYYRRDDEVHRLRLYDPKWIVARLREAGFRVRTIDRYGQLVFPPGYVGFVAKKPGTLLPAS